MIFFGWGWGVRDVFSGWDVVSMVMTDRKNPLILIIAVQSMSG